jgi:anaerobic magnesium-protoporphyrin IX monomethyl ester cyclase
MWGVPGETREDAFKTMRMIKYTKRMMPSMSFYAPYPGSALGNQLIAEGKSLMNRDNYHRFPGDEKLKGIDYAFYNEMLAGKFNEDIERGMSVVHQERSNFWDAMTKA